MAISLAGCSSFHSSITKQQADLRAASTELVGTYELVDSPLNDRQFTTIVAARSLSSDGLDVTLTGPSSRTLVLNGKTCSAWLTDDRTEASVKCDAPAVGIDHFILQQAQNFGTVKDSRGNVPVEKYLMQYVDTRGETHYYLLTRHPAL
ncbi:hypothetical protein [Burkholderia sp. Ac-20365]|uniref:hypothetical protein n=1 Tax=Burkholderia sp. Ac-20365 TaxID=2703897 RepID=UPI00197B5953|nr:hypothetical protein [Burkholderia sp. Ac-20365]MBN3761180.1 hypothetical protein [Burkholderia sp. Ac-20365]